MLKCVCVLVCRTLCLPCVFQCACVSVHLNTGMFVSEVGVALATLALLLLLFNPRPFNVTPWKKIIISVHFLASASVVLIYCYVVVKLISEKASHLKTPP